VVPDIWQSIALFEDSQSYAACPSHKSGIRIKSSKHHWWSDADKRKPKYWEEKSVPVPPWPSECSQEVAGDLTQSSDVRGWRLTAWGKTVLVTWDRLTDFGKFINFERTSFNLIDFPVPWKLKYVKWSKFTCQLLWKQTYVFLNAAQWFYETNRGLKAPTLSAKQFGTKTSYLICFPLLHARAAQLIIELSQ
jgi:hypothetical protein